MDPKIIETEIGILLTLNHPNIVSLNFYVILHLKIVFGTNAHIGSDTLYTKLSLVCCSIIILLDLSYLYKIFFELSKPRKIRHEFLNQKILTFWRGAGGGGGNHFWNFPLLFHLFWMCCFITSVKHDCMLHTICQWAITHLDCLNIIIAYIMSLSSNYINRVSLS